MASASPDQRAAELRALLQQASHDYYILDRPTLSDAEYDRAFRELQQIEQQHPALRPVPPGQTPLTRLQLVERIMADALPVRFQLQMHKVIWAPEQRGV